MSFGWEVYVGIILVKGLGFRIYPYGSCTIDYFCRGMAAVETRYENRIEYNLLNA